MLAVVMVSNDSDVVDGNTASIAELIDAPGDDGGISLREAIQAANNDAADPSDTILFDTSVSGAIIGLTMGELEITDALTLDATALATGITLDAQENSRILNITAATGDFTIAGMTLSRGSTTGDNANFADTTFSGGAVRSLTTGNLTIDRSIISNSSTAGSYAYGGGIFALYNISITNSTITGNRTEGPNGTGGGAATFDELEVIDSTITGNSTAGQYSLGGGLASFSTSITNSTISDNFTTGRYSAGGGVFSYYQLTLSNSTISGNRTEGENAHGAGIYALDPIVISHSTISDNHAEDPSSLGGGIWVDDVAIEIVHTIIAGNTAGGGNPDLRFGSGALIFNYTLIGDSSGLTPAQLIAIGTGTGNLLDEDPRLGPLADNGGSTRTHALLSDSPAIDAGDPDFTPPPTNDQRGMGFPRVLDGNSDGTAIIDLGAFEFEAFVDETAPRVTGMTITDFPDFNLFDSKAGSGGPTPPITSLSIGIEDLPPRLPGIIDPALVGATSVQEFEPNDSIATAQPLDSFFSLSPSDNIGDETENTSRLIPHATLVATGDDTFDYYSFDVSSAGVRGIFDIDFTSNIDPEIFLYDAAGNLLSENNDSITEAGAGGSSATTDSFLDFTFTAPGTYLLAVAQFDSVGNGGGVTGVAPPAGSEYTLHVSIEQHILPLHPAFFSLVGDANGAIPIESVSFTADPSVPGQASTGTLLIEFATPLPDDRFTLTLEDDIRDPSGNALDGETNPTDPILPSGDGLAGGDFVVRFTVDTRPELGVWAAGIAAIDTNGNFVSDPDNLDFTNRDITCHLGFSSDNIFAGSFVANPADTADGFDKLAAYGRVNNQWRWMIDTSNDGVPDIVLNEPFQVNGLPVAGDFDGNATRDADEVGVFDGSQWYFDTDGDFQLDTSFASDLRGFPIVGDFNGDGLDDLGTYRAASGENLFSISLATAPGVWPQTIDHQFRIGLGPGGGAGGFSGFPGVRERPVAADMNVDGIDDLGLWVPDGSTFVPSEEGEWYFLLSGDIASTATVETTVLSRISDGFVSFTPTPFGNDLSARFGNNYAVPLVGNFDPPVTANSAFSAVSAEETFQTTTNQTQQGRRVRSLVFSESPLSKKPSEAPPVVATVKSNTEVAPQTKTKYLGESVSVAPFTSVRSLRSFTNRLDKEPQPVERPTTEHRRAESKQSELSTSGDDEFSLSKISRPRQQVVREFRGATSLPSSTLTSETTRPPDRSADTVVNRDPSVSEVYRSSMTSGIAARRDFRPLDAGEKTLLSLSPTVVDAVLSDTAGLESPQPEHASSIIAVEINLSEIPYTAFDEALSGKRRFVRSLE